METQYSLFPSIEPIGRKPFLKKWIHKKSITPPSSVKGYANYLEDIYRFLFQSLENQNLELAYRFRFTVEAAGVNPFIKRQAKLDKALKRARNRAFHLLEKLLIEIQLEVGLDFDAQLPGFGLTFPLHIKTHLHLIETTPEEQVILQRDLPIDLEQDLNQPDRNGPLVKTVKEEREPFPGLTEERDEGFEYRKVGLHEDTRFQLDEIRRVSDGEETEPEHEPAPLQSEEEPARPIFWYTAENNREKRAEHSEDDDQSSDNIRHSLDAFLLPSGDIEDEDTDPVQTEEAESEETEPEDRWAKYGYGKYLESGPDQDPFKRIQKEESTSTQGGKAKLVAPPPLYNFQIGFKKLSGTGSEEEREPGEILIISSDCIKRRSEQNSGTDHFLGSTSFWNFFQKQDEDHFFRDTTSLIIHQNCIDHRINNINAPKSHALEQVGDNEETFKAFDLVFENEADIPNGQEAEPPIETREEKQDEETGYLKVREEIYNASLNFLRQKDGPLFDYLAGKISVDESDKHEIESWIRNQHSVSTEMYRAISESIMQTTSDDLDQIHRLTRLKLHKNDLPSNRVNNIFSRIKEKNEKVVMDRRELIKLLQRNDFICESGEESKSSITFSRAYSRYRDWRSSLESPKIEVRTLDVSQRQYLIPSGTLSRNWSFLDSPVIKVRTSSDYRKRETLPVLDKISIWKKKQDN